MKRNVKNVRGCFLMGMMLSAFVVGSHFCGTKVLAAEQEVSAVTTTVQAVETTVSPETTGIETTTTEKITKNTEQETTKKKKNTYTGWKKGRYYKNGKYLKGLQQVKGKYYYFSKSGKPVTGWKTVGKKKYFFQTKGKQGVKGKAVVGKKHINKKWYFFDKKGVKKEKSTKEGHTQYFINEKGNLEVYKTGKNYYRPNGKKMDTHAVNDYLTFCRARKVVQKITKSNMTKAQKLKICFEWVRKKPYVRYRYFATVKDWTVVYANDHFLRKGGDCHADGSAMAYLARAIGYKNVYSCLDTDGTTSEGHCWAEIDGKVYDPLFIERGDDYKYYGGSYSNFGLHPILRIAVAKGY